MTIPIQGSLLAATGEPGLSRLGDTVRRTPLADGAWVDVRPGWVRGADELFDRLVADTDWQAERRRMYDRVVDTPRLVRFHAAQERLPHPLLVEARRALSAHYRPELGEPFATTGMCLYRDGDDSVAWHGDRVGRGSTHDTMVAIVSLGEPRPLVLRRVRRDPGEKSLSFVLGPGDLLVMGGSCQRTWEHSVPKLARAAGPRISVQYRVAGVR